MGEPRSGHRRIRPGDPAVWVGMTGCIPSAPTSVLQVMLVSGLAHDDAKRRASLAQPMRCWQARRQVSAYLDTELEPEAAAAVEAHLAACPTCPPLYAALVGVQAAAEGLRDADSVVEAAMAERIRAHLDEERHGSGLPGHRHHRGPRPGGVGGGRVPVVDSPPSGRGAAW
jgi:hypothetical protein